MLVVDLILKWDLLVRQGGTEGGLPCNNNNNNNNNKQFKIYISPSWRYFFLDPVLKNSLAPPPPVYNL